MFINITWNIIILISIASITVLITFNRFITLKQTKIPFTNKSIFILVYKRKSIYVYSSLAIKTVTTPVLGIIPNHNNKLLILY